MSEYGFQAMPDMATIRDFAGPGALTPDSPVLKAHQKFLAGEGNARLRLYIHDRLGEPRDLGDFVYLSQVNQAEAIALAALHHRACRPVTMGSLYWQLNDVWPAISWSSIDHAGRWKLLHYAARRFFAPQVIVAEHVGGATRLALVSDATTPTPARWRIRAFDMAGRLLAEHGAAVTLPPLSATEAARDRRCRAVCRGRRQNELCGGRTAGRRCPGQPRDRRARGAQGHGLSRSRVARDLAWARG